MNRTNEILAILSRVTLLEALLREGVEEAWCDAVIGCAAEIEGKRAAHFYDWQKRSRAALAKGG